MHPYKAGTCCISCNYRDSIWWPRCSLLPPWLLFFSRKRHQGDIPYSPSPLTQGETWAREVNSWLELHSPLRLQKLVSSNPGMQTPKKKLAILPFALPFLLSCFSVLVSQAAHIEQQSCRTCHVTLGMWGACMSPQVIWKGSWMRSLLGVNKYIESMPDWATQVKQIAGNFQKRYP